ncbi:unnamed protein product [Cladocopium goreaui]|uniref:Uncharacterized protein n=1 Tax=Cladocopium goreaui TaxID=2562237 RepID=A0A9P1DIV4_9DINO|nr:unnamed protein product [Cladocopium goreaui]
MVFNAARRLEGWKFFGQLASTDWPRCDRRTHAMRPQTLGAPPVQRTNRSWRRTDDVGQRWLSLAARPSNPSRYVKKPLVGVDGSVGSMAYTPAELLRNSLPLRASSQESMSDLWEDRRGDILDLGEADQVLRSVEWAQAIDMRWPPNFEGLTQLASSLEASPRWPNAERLWRQSAPWRFSQGAEELGAELRLHLLRTGFVPHRRTVRFRGSAVRDGRHDFEAGEVMGKLGGAAKRRTGWQVSLSNYDTEVTRRSQVVVGADGSLVVMSSAEFLDRCPKTLQVRLFPEWRGAASG